MLIVDVHRMRDEETANNLQSDPQPSYDATVNYKYGDEVTYGNYIYYSINRDNTGNQPDTSPLYWVIKEGTNKYRFYNKYPNSLSENRGDDIVLQYNVTGVDAIYLGNIHGDSVTVTAGATFTKVIPAKAHSPIDAWGVKAYSQMSDFYVPLGALYTGVIDITITKSTTTNNSALGFINYGNLKDAGCTLMDSIKYNIRSAGGVDWARIDLDAFRARTYTEIKLPIKINETTVKTRDVIDTLSNYRGVPVLIIGDDEGKREETIFFGVYTDLEAKISDKNSYIIVLRSLSYKAFIAPTEPEQSLIDAQRAKEEEEENNPDSGGSTTPPGTCCDRAFLKLKVELEGTGAVGYMERTASFLLNQDTDLAPQMVFPVGNIKDLASLNFYASAINSDFTVKKVTVKYRKWDIALFEGEVTEMAGEVFPDGADYSKMYQLLPSDLRTTTDARLSIVVVDFEPFSTNTPAFTF